LEKLLDIPPPYEVIAVPPAELTGVQDLGSVVQANVAAHIDALVIAHGKAEKEAVAKCTRLGQYTAHEIDSLVEQRKSQLKGALNDAILEFLEFTTTPGGQQSMDDLRGTTRATFALFNAINDAFEHVDLSARPSWYCEDFSARAAIATVNDRTVTNWNRVQALAIVIKNQGRWMRYLEAVLTTGIAVSTYLNGQSE
jgi:hypothetical protein